MRPLILTLAFLLAASALEDPQGRLVEMEKAYSAQREAYLRDWLSRASLDPVPVPQPENPKDARPSEARAKHHAEDVNKILATARRIRERRDTEGMAHADGEIWGLDRPQAIAAILEAQAGRPAAADAPQKAPHKAPTGGFVSVNPPQTESAEGNR